MLEKPDLEDQLIIDCLQEEYGLRVAEIAFLPLGADLNTAVYRAVGGDRTAYFVKLRSGEFNEAAVTVPKYLSQLGIQEIIPPLTTVSGRLWARLEAFHLILYPFVEGLNGFERSLTRQQWIEFGSALKKFHCAYIPGAITGKVPAETFPAHYREAVKLVLARIEVETFTEPVAAKMAAFVKTKSAEIYDLVKRTEDYARILRDQRSPFILCHGDIHAWNLLIPVNDTFYMVDWDTLIFAPKERDLMFIGAGLGGNGFPPQEEEALFYQGYGQIQVDPIALAYYRFERIIEDTAIFCEQVLFADGGGEDRQQALVYLQSNFLPGHSLDLAYRSDIAKQKK